MNPAQPPEGILDPQQPYWPADKVGEITWLRLKGKLTGRRVEGISENFTSYVKLGDADADRLIANIKKWGKYPTVNQNDKYGGALNNEAYQKWLVEEFLEKPFREETDKKIEEAEQEARLQEIVEQRKNNKKQPDPVEETSAEEEQKELDKDQEVLQDKIDDLTDDLDDIKEPPPPQEEQKPQQETKPEDKEEESDKDLTKIKGSLEEIKGSLQIQATDLEKVNQNTSSSIATLESLKQLFQSHTDILRRQAEQAKYQAEQQASGQTIDASGNEQGTDLTASNKAEGVIQGVDGDVLTIKTTEGQFRQGEKISQGGSGGGFLDMLKGIAGKFLGKGKGGGGSPVKMSSGGYSKSPTQLAGGGTLTPGVYNRPTRGNLGLQQMAIPLNRNVGKPFKKRDDAKRLRKLDQPMIDIMSHPLKAIGLSIISVAGNFLKALGPLGGFFLPFAKGLVKGFAMVLGVPAGIIMSLLGGPAYAAMDQQDKQQNIFSKLWNDLMRKFGFDLGGEDDKDKKKKKKNKSNNTGTTAGAGDWAPLLELISKHESGGNWEAMYPSTTLDGATGMTISEVARKASGAVGKYQQKPEYLVSRAKAAGLNPDEDLYSPENQNKIVSEVNIGQNRGGNQWLKGNKTDEAFMDGLAYEFASLPDANGNFKYPGQSSSTKPSEIKEALSDVKERVSAAEGVQIKVKEEAPMGKFMGWQILDGPVSGYKVSDNLEMHGKEAYLQHENGFSILPMENKEYSLSKDPMRTIDRWKEILGPSGTASTQTEFESGGKKVFDPKAYSAGSESSKYIPVGSGNNAKSYTVLYKRQGATGTYIIKAISKKVSGNLFSGDNLTSVNINSAEGKSVLQSTNVRQYFKSRTAKSLKLEIKPDPDASIYYGYNQAYQTTKNAWLQRNASQKDAEMYAAAAAREFAITRKEGSYLPGSQQGLDRSLSDVSVTSGDTSTSTASQQPPSDPFTALETALTSILVGAGVDALKPKNKEEYERMKTELQSTFKMTTASAQTPAAARANAPAPAPARQQPTVVQQPAAPAASSGERAADPMPFSEQLTNMSILYYA